MNWKNLARAAFWLGLLVIAAYWYSVHPTGWFRGYMEDLCGPELDRQLMAEQLLKSGKPGFFFNQIMTPKGALIPYMSWMIERDWLGAYFWMWNRDFPFQWFWFGVSLFGSYFATGFLLRKSRLGPGAAWGLATLVVLLHVPRHFKIWLHSEHLWQHWIYWSVFIDVLILQRVFRERSYPVHAELWRAVCLLGMLGTAGYYWGPLMMEWAAVRAFVGLRVLKYRREGQAPGIRIARGPLVAALVAGLFLLVVDIRWYLPLFEAVRQQPEVWQGMSWFAKPFDFLFPLWLARLPGHPDFSRNLTSETLMGIGWTYWALFFAGLFALRKKRGGIGLRIVAPFLLVLLIAFAYSTTGLEFFQQLIQHWPFMRFFRIAVRWGLLLPVLVTAVIALAWPELSAWFQARRRHVRAGLGLAWVALALIESTWLLEPVLALPPLPETVTSMMERIRQLPGDTVLNLPFCTAGGNGVCTAEQCPQYPYSTVGSCLRGWHDKKVHGLYGARMLEQQCAIYREPPFTSWFASWREGRCLNDKEWEEFCAYLGGHREVAAILLFPDIWTAARSPECRAKFDRILGPPLGEATFSLERNPGGYFLKGTRVLWYAPACGRLN